MFQKYVGASLVVLGIVMTGSGLELTDRPNVLIPGLLLSRPWNESALLLLGGVLSVLVGMALLVIRKQRAA